LSTRLTAKTYGLVLEVSRAGRSFTAAKELAGADLQNQPVLHCCHQAGGARSLKQQVSTEE